MIATLRSTTGLLLSVSLSIACGPMSPRDDGARLGNDDEEGGDSFDDEARFNPGCVVEQQALVCPLAEGVRQYRVRYATQRASWIKLRNDSGRYPPDRPRIGGGRGPTGPRRGVLCPPT